MPRLSFPPASGAIARPLPPASIGAAAGSVSADDVLGPSAALGEGNDPLAGCWDAIRSLVCLTCLALPQSATAAGSARQPGMSPHGSRAGGARHKSASARRPASNRGDLACFELLGLDVMLDEQGRPWLLEVNASPALSVEGLADEGLKPALVRDTVQLVSAEAQRFGRLQSASSPAKQAATGRLDLRPAKPLRVPAAEVETPGLAGRPAGERVNADSQAQAALSRSGVSGTLCGPFDPLTSPYSARTRYPSTFELVFPFDERTEHLSHQLASSLDRAGLACADVAQSWLHADAPALAAAADRETLRRRCAASSRSPSPADGDAARRPRESAGVAEPDTTSDLGGPHPLDDGPLLPPPRERAPTEVPSLRAQPTLSQLRAARQGVASRSKPKRSAASPGAGVVAGAAAGSASFDPKDASPADTARRTMRALVRATVERYGSWADGAVPLSP